MIRVLCALCLLACSSCSSVSYAFPTLDRKAYADIPGLSVERERYPSIVTYCDYEYLTDYKYGATYDQGGDYDYVTVERGSFSSILFSSGYEYMLCYGELTYNQDFTQVRAKSLTFAMYTRQGYTEAGLSVIPIGFSPFHFIVKDNSQYPNAYDVVSYCYSVLFDASYGQTSPTRQVLDTYPEIRTISTFIGSDEPFITDDSFNLTIFDGLAAAAVGDYLRFGDDGWSKGYAAGYSYGEKVGKAEGAAETDAAIALVPTLFGSIAGVPITILGGLSDLAIWNVPILAVIFTFLFIALVLWLIKRFV